LVYVYKHEKLIKFCLGLGGVLGVFFHFNNIYFISDLTVWIQNNGYNIVIISVLGMLVAFLAILTSLNPYDPIPLHWLNTLIFAAILFTLTSILSGLIIFCAFIVCLIDKKKYSEGDEF